MIQEFKFPWGKYMGKVISDPEIDLSYLKWVESEWTLTKSQRDQINFEIKRRESDESSLGRVVRRSGVK